MGTTFRLDYNTKLFCFHEQLSRDIMWTGVNLQPRSALLLWGFIPTWRPTCSILTCSVFYQFKVVCGCSTEQPYGFCSSFFSWFRKVSWMGKLVSDFLDRMFLFPYTGQVFFPVVTEVYIAWQLNVLWADTFLLNYRILNPKVCLHVWLIQQLKSRVMLSLQWNIVWEVCSNTFAEVHTKVLLPFR